MSDKRVILDTIYEVIADGPLSPEQQRKLGHACLGLEFEAGPESAIVRTQSRKHAETKLLNEGR